MYEWVKYVQIYICCGGEVQKKNWEWDLRPITTCLSSAVCTCFKQSKKKKNNRFHTLFCIVRHSRTDHSWNYLYSAVMLLLIIIIIIKGKKVSEYSRREWSRAVLNWIHQHPTIRQTNKQKTNLLPDIFANEVASFILFCIRHYAVRRHGLRTIVG